MGLLPGYKFEHIIAWWCRLYHFHHVNFTRPACRYWQDARFIYFFFSNDTAEPFIPSVYAELNLWWALCFLSHPLYFFFTNPRSPKASWTPFELGFVWCAFRSGLWVGNFRFIGWQCSKYSDVYHLAFPNDPLQSKILVYAVYAAELVQSILLAKKFYQEFAAGFGSFEAIDTSGLLWITVPIISSIGMNHPFFLAAVVRLPTSKSVAAVVQIFYAYRVRMLADAYVIPVIIVLVSFSSSYTLNGFVLICVACISRTRRRDCTRCNR